MKSKNVSIYKEGYTRIHRYFNFINIITKLKEVERIKKLSFQEDNIILLNLLKPKLFIKEDQKQKNINNLLQSVEKKI